MGYSLEKNPKAERDKPPRNSSRASSSGPEPSVRCIQMPMQKRLASIRTIPASMYFIVFIKSLVSLPECVSIVLDFLLGCNRRGIMREGNRFAGI